MSGPLRLGLVGLGKIARDEHLPAIARTEGAELVAVASRHSQAEGLSNYSALSAMLAAEPELDAVILCQPPQFRYADARRALLAGKHVFLEKPPGATVSEVEALTELARERGLTLYASWHSRHSAGAAEARAWCAAHALTRVEITWKEDVRRWHPGQEWIWQAGGFGVFDPGINALSILTEALREQVCLVNATLEIPANRETPIAAQMTMETASGVPVTASFDWRETGPQIWRILFEAGAERHQFSQGGDDAASAAPGADSVALEYRAMYRRFVDLVRAGESDVDVAPLRLVADAYLRGRVRPTEPFED